MRAFVMERYGAADAARLAEVADLPPPGAGEVQVAVHAAGLNPVDYKIRQGKLRALLPLRLPAIMGNEMAGEVVATGPGVTGFAPGDRVFARVGKVNGGALAEAVNVPAEYLAHVPEGLALTDAAGVPLAGLTALQALREVLGVGPGMRVLISGGAGGVGTLAIQIAKALGAHVTTTASPRGAALVRDLGADAVIDYTTETIAGRPRDFDAGFDLIGGDTLREMFSVVKPGGTVVTISDLPEPETARDLGRGWGMAAVFWWVSRGLRRAAKAAGVRYRMFFMRPDGAGLADLAAMIDDGRLRVVVDRVFPFEDTAEAMAYLEAGRAKGKVVVEVGA